MPVTKPRFRLNDLDVVDPAELLSQADQSTSARWRGLINSYRMPRGEEAGRGWFAMTWRDAQHLPLDDVVTLKITYDGDDASASELVISRLYVVQVTSAVSGGDADANLGMSSLVVVEVADGRIFGPLSNANVRVNQRAPEGTFYGQGEKTLSWNDLFQLLWQGLPSAFSVAPNLPGNPPGHPENYVFEGVPGWAAVIKVCRDMGYIVRPDLDGQFQLIDPAKYDVQTDRLLASLDVTHGLYSDNVRQSSRVLIPEQVTCYFPTRKWQHQTGDGAEQVTSADLWRATQPFVVRVPTFGGGEEAFPVSSRTRRITNPGTSLPVWFSVPAEYDPNTGEIENDGELIRIAQQFGKQWLDAQLNGSAAHHRVYSGLHRILPGARVTAVVWRDVGDGLKTEVIQFPRFLRVTGRAGTASLFTEPQWPGVQIAVQSVASTPVGLTRPVQPYHRKVYGTLVEPIKAESTGRLLVHYVEVNDEGKVNWKPAGEDMVVEVIAFNNAGTIPKGTSGEAEYLWQRGGTDGWVFSSGGGSSGGGGATMRFDCVGGGSAVSPVPTGQHFTPTTLQVDKSVFILGVEGDPSAPGSSGDGEVLVTLTMGGGPTNSLLWQGGGGDAPKWTKSPTVAGPFIVGVSGEDDGVLAIEGEGGHVRLYPGPATEQSIKFPDRKQDNKGTTGAPGSHFYIAGKSGQCLQLGWTHEGVGIPSNPTKFSFTGYAGGSCSGEAGCITLEFEHGILVRGSPGATETSFDYQTGDAQCEFEKQDPDDPCEDAGGGGTLGGTAEEASRRRQQRNDLLQDTGEE